MRIIAVLLAVALLGAVAAPAARADADPASDVLLYQDVFYPYDPVVSPGLKAQLDELTARAKRDGFPIKVAIVASGRDLGAVSSFIDDPGGYARFLEKEIRGRRPQPLLVAMAYGFGTAATGPKGEAAVAAMDGPRAVDTDGLTRAAIDAVRRIAAANGHPLPAPKPQPGAARPSEKSRSGGSPLLLVFAPAALLAAGALAASWRRRRRAGQER